MLTWKCWWPHKTFPELRVTSCSKHFIWVMKIPHALVTNPNDLAVPLKLVEKGRYLESPRPRGQRFLIWWLVSLVAPLLKPGFPGGSLGKESTWTAGDVDLIPGWESSSGGGHGTPLQWSCLENPMGGGTLAGYSPRGRKVSDMTERLGTHVAEVTPSIGPSVAIWRSPFETSVYHLGVQGTSLPDLGPDMGGVVHCCCIPLGQQNRRKETRAYALQSFPSLLRPPQVRGSPSVWQGSLVLCCCSSASDCFSLNILFIQDDVTCVGC